MRQELLRIRDLAVHFETRRSVARAVDQVDLTLYAGERFGLVGESGSGKTTLLLALLRMIKEPGRIVNGAALMQDVDLLQLDEESMRQTRLARIALVPQGAMNSLNPVLRIEDQFTLTLRDHGAAGDLKKRVVELLDLVGLDASVARLYPHELSGGMKQRVCIALAISLGPRLILADEPTSALDVVVQRQIVQTLHALQEQFDVAILLVGHDMGLMAQFAERIGVMYGGRLVEVGPVAEIFNQPKHPYTQLLISSIPSFERRGEFKGIPGIALSLLEPPAGCLFHPRCPQAMDRCGAASPSMRQVGPGHETACFLYEEEDHAAST